MISGFEITEVIFNLHSVNHQFGNENEQQNSILRISFNISIY